MKKKIAIIFLALLILSGCTKRITIEDKETNTKKSYVSNIICKPEDETLQKIYSENKDNFKIDYDSLPVCKELKINSGGYEGLWTSLFVKPLAWIIIKVGIVVKNNGFAIMIVGFILRLILLPISLKSTNMSENLKTAQKDLEKIEKKYKGKEDRDSMMAKSQEMMLIYRKYNINPLSSCLFAFLQLPIFFAFLEAVYRVPAFFENDFLKVFNLGTTPIEGIVSGNYWYILLLALILLTTYYSFKNMNNTVTGNEMQQKQMKMMSTFMLIFIGLASTSLPTSIALYWIVSSGFTVVQNLIVKKGKL